MHKKYAKPKKKQFCIFFLIDQVIYILFTVFQGIDVGRGDSIIHDTPWTDGLKKPETIQENGIKKLDS